MAEDGDLQLMREELGRLELDLERLAGSLAATPMSFDEMHTTFRKFRTYGTPTPVFHHLPVQAIPMLSPLLPEQVEEQQPRASLPDSPVRLQINLVPGGLRHIVEVRVHQPVALTVEGAELKERVGDATWPHFIRQCRELYYTANKAAQEIDGLRDALNADDFARWTAKASSYMAMLDELIGSFATEFERVSPQLLAAVRAQRHALQSYFTALIKKNPFTGQALFVTGEYER